jgi:hypothetical protein
VNGSHNKNKNSLGDPGFQCGELERAAPYAWCEKEKAWSRGQDERLGFHKLVIPRVGTTLGQEGDSVTNTCSGPEAWQR